jgi:DNA-binding NarL/FixJ family response regulator
MGGKQVFELLKKIDPKLKVLLASGYSMEGEAKEIMDQGCDGFIQKPFNMHELSQKLRSILEK